LDLYPPSVQPSFAKFMDDLEDIPRVIGAMGKQIQMLLKKVAHLEELLAQPKFQMQYAIPPKGCKCWPKKCPSTIWLPKLGCGASFEPEYSWGGACPTAAATAVKKHGRDDKDGEAVAKKQKQQK